MSTPLLAPAHPLEIRWLGRVPYREAWDLQRAFWTARTEGRTADTLLLLEHPRTYTLGRTAHEANLGAGRLALEAGGAEVLDVDRGGDVTYHGPGQLVGYPILDLTRNLAEGRRIPDLHAYLRDLEEVLIRALATFGLEAFRRPGYTGVWLPAGKVAAIGVKVTRGVSMHGFALNVDPALDDFTAINPCGIGALGVTSIRAAAGTPVTLADAVPPVTAAFAEVFGGDVREARVAWARGAGAGTGTGTPITLGRRPAPRPPAEDPRRPEWMRVRARFTDDFHRLKALVHGASLHTVCEEAGCPNIYECWADGTATLMILGDTCTRACGFCKVHTGKPPGLDVHEPERAAEAVAAMRLRHAVVTSVARDDLDDGGASIFAATIAAIRRRVPGCAVEVLIPDFKGDEAALRTVLDAQPDVLNHNLETVARLQRDVRPNAGYARSLTLLARSKAAGAVTKSGLIAGMGETVAELETALRDLATAGVDIVTLGQYLRPSAAHRPVDRFLTPDEFTALAAYAERHGIGHCEAGPLVRSSYHARQAAAGIA